MKQLTPEIVKKIAEYVCAGKSFRAIAREDGMPHRVTMHDWYKQNEVFRRIIDNARLRSTARAAEMPTPERLDRDGGVAWEAIDRKETGEVIQMRARARQTCRLDEYLERQIITRQQHEAGIRFARLYFDAGKVPRTAVMWRERVDGLRGEIMTLTDAQLRLDEVTAALNVMQRDVVRSVCGLDEDAGSPGRFRALVSGLVILVIYFE
jgi:hypothetical protein